MPAAKLRPGGWEAYRARPPTPLKAKKLLAALRIPQAELGRSIVLSSGLNPCEAAVSQILNRDIWPASTPRAQVQQQIEDCLRRWGADEEDIKEAFDKNEGLYRPRSTRQSRALLAQAHAPIAEVEAQLPEKAMLTQAARKHFALFRDPFQDDVQEPDDVFLGKEQRFVREYMFTTARHGGFIAVIGESGAGKSVLRRDLIDRIGREKQPIRCIMPRIIAKERLTAGGICDAIILDLSQQRPRQSLEAKARQIEELLTESSRAGSSHVLIIEEAHDLALSTLKYLKRFLELEDGFRRLLAIILIAQPEINGLLSPTNISAREVVRRCEKIALPPLNGDLEAYLTLKLQRHGKRLEDIFDQGAFDAMRQALTFNRGRSEAVSMLYPLVANNLAVQAMNLAAELGAAKVDAEIIRHIGPEV